MALSLPVSVLRLIKPFTSRWLFAAPHALKSFYLNNLSKWNGWELYARVAMPVMVIRGHRDIVFARPIFERVAKEIAGAEDVDIGSSGHMVMLERRAAVDRALGRFLEDEGRRSWRAETHAPPGAGRAALPRERPWLSHYENGVPYTIGLPRVPLHHFLRSAVRRFPNRAAVRFEGGTLSYRRLNSEVNRAANALLGLGIGKGARVALLLPNVPQMIIGFFAALKAGAAAVFLPPLTAPEELIRQARDSEAGVLVTLTQWAGLARQIQDGAGIPHVVLTDAAQYAPFYKRWISRWRNRGLGLPGALTWEQWLEGRSDKSPALDVQPDDLAVIQYTGGTTAESKGVMLSHRNLVANALQTRQWMPAAREGGERFLCVLPFSHSYGLTAALNVPVAIGATLILKATFNVSEVLETIRRQRPTIFPGVPAMYVAINNYPGVRRFRIASIRACISGSAPLPIEVQEAFEKLTKGRLVEGYGLTEAGPITHANPLDGTGKVGTIGVPIPSTEARIVDLKTGRRAMPVGQVGELAVRGPQVMLGYWRNPEATRKVITADGWLLTGDAAVMDAEGYFRIVARKADMWYPDKPEHPAFPRDVEEVLYEIPQVKEAAVVAIAGQPIAFVITTKERPTTEAVTAYCKRRLSPALVPRMVIFMDDFPRTFIGKVLRRELAKRYESANQR
jgi:long-chain acyl-CoA synthetase